MGVPRVFAADMRRGVYAIGMDDIGGGWEESNLICCLRRCAVVFGSPKGIERNLGISFSDLICTLLAVLQTPRYMNMERK